MFILLNQFLRIAVFPILLSGLLFSSIIYAGFSQKIPLRGQIPGISGSQNVKVTLQENLAGAIFYKFDKISIIEFDNKGAFALALEANDNDNGNFTIALQNDSVFVVIEVKGESHQIQLGAVPYALFSGNSQPGAKGDRGDKGEPGIPGKPGTYAGKTCTLGEMLTGFSSQNELICTRLSGRIYGKKTPLALAAGSTTLWMATAACNAGDVVISGGIRCGGSNDGVTASFPIAGAAIPSGGALGPAMTGDGWAGRCVLNVGATSLPDRFAFAFCLKP